ncbi:MAG TPA: hypothetical protein DCZ84_02755 [Candidatus Vogelbacteria bacterium]|uniref:peptide chain release factor N(5)-glutamine methyltransferase n=1 Tax=Candidatus Vogelbacteria bacterium RIFOXYD1_FULL_51_18 TaxID=1802440 RepID=A0A1G2QIY0_9BACT|nr:MAG: hypothetical protein A2569_03075 [Candidatus Vogelbacteria bacterium RIFOXYD1_FULL_51_18]HBB65526.1 hypothetical protein [Candidatus Vogelbacteria bacterium]HBC44374.1 hypothetical protein [Candidatus Vogelbacteria bacterium]HCQ91802.1 hypothetical protein [Candidatus Vogelbacteria bacterium]
MNTKELLMRDKYHGHADAGSLENDLMRIAAGEPIDYVIGWKPFCGIEADLSLQPLIPREETEYWVSECIRFLGSETRRGGSHFQNLRCLDMCTGSGCIAAALLKAFSFASCDCVDNDPQMLKAVWLTMERNSISPERYRLIESDMWEHVEGVYDLICANPPYVGEQEEVGEGVREHEPTQAVFAGDAGRAALSKFFEGLEEHLAEGGPPVPNGTFERGLAYCEFSPMQEAWVQEHLTTLACQGKICRDQYGRARFLRMGKRVLYA